MRSWIQDEGTAGRRESNHNAEKGTGDLPSARASPGCPPRLSPLFVRHSPLLSGAALSSSGSPPRSFGSAPSSFDVPLSSFSSPLSSSARGKLRRDPPERGRDRTKKGEYRTKRGESRGGRPGERADGASGGARVPSGVARRFSGGCLEPDPPGGLSAGPKEAPKSPADGLARHQLPSNLSQILPPAGDPTFRGTSIPRSLSP